MTPVSISPEVRRRSADITPMSWRRGAKTAALTVKVCLQGRHGQLVGPLDFFLFAELPLFSLERDHFPLRRFHEAFARRFRLLCRHVTHTRLLPPAKILKRRNSEKVRACRIAVIEANGELRGHLNDGRLRGYERSRNETPATDPP
jgi:hypothetical protein